LPSSGEEEKVREAFGRRWLVVCAVLAVGLAAAPASPQILYGSVVGTIKDAQAAPVAGATVTIVNKDNNLTREGVTNALGAYTLINVPPGRYDVKIALTGFREGVRTNVPVTIGEVSRVDMTMEVGTLTESVTVESTTTLLKTDKADVSTELKSSEIVAMPLNRWRNYQALMNLVPGTTPMAFGNAETDTPARSLATNVNGQANTNNSVRTDGATNVNIWLPNHNMLISGAETIDTVNISTSSFDAEQGMAGGAAVTVITKSGTNRIRGSAFEFYNSDKLNANPRSFTAGAPPPKLPLKSHNYGATLGGPIKKDELFFFASYERFKREFSLFTLFSVPDAALRAGNFGGATNAGGSQQIIYDPLTGNPDGTGRTPFPGNQVPANRIDPIALLAQNNLYPLPNVQGIGVGGLTNNYRRQEDRTFDRKTYDLKLNWNRTSAHQIWLKGSYMDAVVDDLTNYLGPNPAAEGDGGFTKVYALTGGSTWTLSPTLFMDMTLGWAKQKQDVLPPDFEDGNYGLDVLGIPGTNDQGVGDTRYAGQPPFRMGSFSVIGNRDTWNPIFRDEQTYSLAVNLTKVSGRHEIRGGYFVNYLYLDHWQPGDAGAAPRGDFTFNANTTALRGGQAGNFYNNYASFLLGLVGTTAKSFQNELMTTREWQHALYLRDRWQVSSKLTLDLGLRWEYYPIAKRADGRGIDRLDLQTLDVIVAGRGSNPQTNGLKAGLDNFAPRLGAVYRLNEDTIFRAGYGLTYNNQAWGRPMRGDLDYPVTVNVSYINPESFGWYSTLAQGIQPTVGPDISSGRIPLDRAAGFMTPEPDNVDRGYVQTWNVSFERRLPFDTSLTVGYVGAKGTGGFAGLDVNAPTTLGGGGASRPYASMGRQIAIYSWGQRLRTRYNSLQVAINKPFSKGLLFKGAYTLSKSMNENDGEGRVLGLAWNTPSELYRNWAPAGFDRRHNFQFGFSYALPWQHKDGYGGFLKAIVSDWQINGMFGAFSGTPFTVTADNGRSVNTPSNTQTADLVGTFTPTGKIGAAGTWFDTSAFAAPTGVRFGTSTRNQFYGPGGYNLDLSLFRSFPIGGERRIEFRVEAGNVLNHGVYANPNVDSTSSSFGLITTLLGGGAFTNQTYPERQIRMVLRLDF
jgi:Carboxypeptidase regulatory-like domain/TonB dependent receptor-like, beta-barrel